ncbi:MAG: hypothetical protein AAGF30_01075 [Pseudomonadota bacterium]
MALRVLTSAAVDAAQLPWEVLAARLRMPEGWRSIPELVLRVDTRLQAALAMAERRTGRILVRREVVLVGEGDGTRSIALGVEPVNALIGVDVDLGGGFEELPGAALSDGSIELPASLFKGAGLRVTVEAGYGLWDAVPADLAEVVLLIAERGASGDTALDALIDESIAPFSQRRLGRLT